VAQASAANKQLARTVADRFGQRPRITRFRDEHETRWVDIAQATDSPVAGVTSYATLGLSDWPLMDDGQEYPVRVEFLGACAGSYNQFANVLSTAAFNVIKDDWFVYPGRIFPDVVAMYYPAFPMKHLLFVPPFLWEESFSTQEFPDKTVAWLFAVPISEDEMQYARIDGADALEELFEHKQIDVFDLERTSVAY